ncbi:MAG: ABC transporter ATP-binding protein [Clostridiales bacterium]|nr:ABC transporter ATP-binding protein [Clostridiales bacterium]
MNALEIDRLTKRYSNFTLGEVSFCLPEGTIMGFIGENGAGKSTVINLITGAVKKDSGTIKIYGKNTEEMNKSDWEEIGTVIAECGFPSELRLQDVNSILKSIYKNWDESKFFYYTDRFSLNKKGRIKDYSSGMKMKLEIAIAFSHGAKILILDEATNGLDPSARLEILDMLMDFIQDERCAVLISSHIISDLEKICDYITFIHGGKILFSEEKDKLLEKYVVINADEKQIEELDKPAIVAMERTKWSTKAMVLKDMIPQGFETEKTNIEEIMLYHIKRGAK